MHFEFDERTRDLMAKVQAFMDEHVYPNEHLYDEAVSPSSESRWQIPPIIEDLKVKARAAGLWNMFLPDSEEGMGLRNIEFAPLAEIMGRVHWASEAFNCAAPDTGNMEILHRYGSEEQKDTWLRPLLEGEIRSSFLMTEPAVASSDARNIRTQIKRDGDDYVINGHKWWSSGAADPRCKLYILMGQTDPEASPYNQQSMILVPADAPGIRIQEYLSAFGYDHAPHGHGDIVLENVRVPKENILHGEGRGFEIAQGRLGPGRIHHCMRLVGVADRALEMMCERLLERQAFGKTIAEHSVWEERIAEARTDIEMCRLLTLKAAYMMDTVGNREARSEIAMIKVAAPKVALKVLDAAIQAYGGAGVSDRTFLAWQYGFTRALRIADGPDEVHNRTIARLTLKAAKARLASKEGA